MLHTVPVSGAGWTREDALAAAVRRVNQLFGALALLGEKRVVSVQPTFLTDPGPGPQAVMLIYVLDVSEAIAQLLDEQLDHFPPQEAIAARPVPQKPGDAWLYSLGKWLPIKDPCTYPEHWTVDVYPQSLEAQGYHYERDFFDLEDVCSLQADEVAVGFAIYVADDPEEAEHHPPYPYRVEACVFLCDWEPPVYIADYPSLLDLLAAFAHIVQTRLQIAHLVRREQEKSRGEAR